MNSLDLLAEGAGPAAPAFEADFYVATAAVVPVLFLAIVVSGPAYRQRLYGIWRTCLSTFKHPYQTSMRLPWPIDRPIIAVIETTARLFFASILALVLAFGIAIIAAGGYGELLAIYALYQAHDQHTTRLTVLLATMLLVILVVAVPLITYLINVFSPEPASQEQPVGKTDPAPTRNDRTASHPTQNPEN